MLLKITHKTDVLYSDFISESVMELRMVPRQEQDQHRLSFDSRHRPAHHRQQLFRLARQHRPPFSVNAFHKQIRIVATSVVETDRPRKEPERFRDPGPFPPKRTITPSTISYSSAAPSSIAPQLRDLADMLAPKPGISARRTRPPHAASDRRQIHLQKGRHHRRQPHHRILASGSGVCQDFTHLMIGLARALRIPARYVSGLIHPDADKYRGYTQTHAWCELLFPSAGWIGFDPANRCVVGGNFVKVAVGRDFRDVPPNRGVYRGDVEESIDVAIKSEELPFIPQELAADRMQSLEVPAYPNGAAALRGTAGDQQEHQQQQQQQ